MPLYHVQDSDRPLWIVARDFGEAVEKWKIVIFRENYDDHFLIEDIEDKPQGVWLICDDDELIIYETTQRALAECSKTKQEDTCQK